MNLFDAQMKAFKTAVEHGFWPPADAEIERDHLINTKLLLITSEVVEAMDVLRAEERVWSKFGDELADIIIRTLDLSGYLGFDMEARVRHKMECNELRSVQHGGKRF